MLILRRAFCPLEGGGGARHTGTRLTERKKKWSLNGFKSWMDGKDSNVFLGMSYVLFLNVLIIKRFINVVCGLHISATYHAHNVQAG